MWGNNLFEFIPVSLARNLSEIADTRVAPLKTVMGSWRLQALSRAERTELLLKAYNTRSWRAHPFILREWRVDLRSAGTRADGEWISEGNYWKILMCSKGWASGIVAWLVANHWIRFPRLREAQSFTWRESVPPFLVISKQTSGRFSWSYSLQMLFLMLMRQAFGLWGATRGLTRLRGASAGGMRPQIDGCIWLVHLAYHWLGHYTDVKRHLSEKLTQCDWLQWRKPIRYVLLQERALSLSRESRNGPGDRCYNASADWLAGRGHSFAEHLSPMLSWDPDLVEMKTIYCTYSKQVCILQTLCTHAVQCISTVNGVQTNEHNEHNSEYKEHMNRMAIISPTWKRPWAVQIISKNACMDYGEQ